MQYVREYGVINRTIVESLLNVSSSTALRLLQQMVKKNMLQSQGKARDTKYILMCN